MAYVLLFWTIWTQQLLKVETAFRWRHCWQLCCRFSLKSTHLHVSSLNPWQLLSDQMLLSCLKQVKGCDVPHHIFMELGATTQLCSTLTTQVERPHQSGHYSPTSTGGRITVCASCPFFFSFFAVSAEVLIRKTQTLRVDSMDDLVQEWTHFLHHQHKPDTNLNDWQ